MCCSHMPHLQNGLKQTLIVAKVPDRLRCARRLAIRQARLGYQLDSVAGGVSPGSGYCLDSVKRH